MKFSDLFDHPKLSFDVLALFSNQLIWGFATGMVGLFLPIFLFEKFNRSVQNVLIFYIISFTLFGLLVPIGARIMSKVGLKRTLIISIPCLIGYYLGLYFFDNFESLIFLASALITITLFRILYWIPYHVDFAEFMNPRGRGKKIAFLASLSFLAGILAPFIAGFVINKFGFNILFIVAIAIIAISIFPLFFIRPNPEKYSYSYFQTFKELLTKKNRKIFLAYGADGAETVIAVTIWPIFIFEILKENYIAVGVISAAIVLVTILLQLTIGSLTDKMRKRSLIRTGSALYALGWIIKMFIQTGFQIFIVSSYQSLVGIVKGIPFTTLIYEQMADRGHYIDEYTVLREVSLNTGRVLMLTLCFILLGFVGLTWTFLLAAIASLFINIL
jgi:YQGE family putative transporter